MTPPRNPTIERYLNTVANIGIFIGLNYDEIYFSSLSTPEINIPLLAQEFINQYDPEDISINEVLTCYLSSKLLKTI